MNLKYKFMVAVGTIVPLVYGCKDTVIERGVVMDKTDRSLLLASNGDTLINREIVFNRSNMQSPFLTCSEKGDSIVYNNPNRRMVLVFNADYHYRLNGLSCTELRYQSGMLNERRRQMARRDRILDDLKIKQR